MPKSTLEYADWLDERKLTWPAAPKRIAVSAQPYCAPLAGIRGVAFNVYGTLLRISEGRLLFDHPQALRMEIAMDKTIKEFNFWNSMTRKPGPPSKTLLPRYHRALDQLQMASSGTIGEPPEIDARALWLKLIRELQQKEYTYDSSFYGSLPEFAEKVSYFFHASLQGIEAEEGALETLRFLSASKSLCLLADAQRFTGAQMLRAFRRQGTLRSLEELFEPELMTLSWREGIRKPSKSLYRRAVDRFRRAGVSPGQVLYVGTWLRDDLALAKEAGMRTALLAADGTSLAATPEEIAKPELRPDRLLTRLDQLVEVVGH